MKTFEAQLNTKKIAKGLQKKFQNARLTSRENNLSTSQFSRNKNSKTNFQS